MSDYDLLNFDTPGSLEDSPDWDVYANRNSYRDEMIQADQANGIRHKILYEYHHPYITAARVGTDEYDLKATRDLKDPQWIVRFEDYKKNARVSEEYSFSQYCYGLLYGLRVTERAKLLIGDNAVQRECRVSWRPNCVWHYRVESQRNANEFGPYDVKAAPGDWINWSCTCKAFHKMYYDLRNKAIKGACKHILAANMYFTLKEPDLTQVYSDWFATGGDNFDSPLDGSTSKGQVHVEEEEEESLGFGSLFSQLSDTLGGGGGISREGSQGSPRVPTTAVDARNIPTRYDPQGYPMPYVFQPPGFEEGGMSDVDRQRNLNTDDTEVTRVRTRGAYRKQIFGNSDDPFTEDSERIVTPRQVNTPSEDERGQPLNNDNTEEINADEPSVPRPLRIDPPIVRGPVPAPPAGRKRKRVSARELAGLQDNYSQRSYHGKRPTKRWLNKGQVKKHYYKKGG